MSTMTSEKLHAVSREGRKKQSQQYRGVKQHTHTLLSTIKAVFVWFFWGGAPSALARVTFVSPQQAIRSCTRLLSTLKFQVTHENQGCRRGDLTRQPRAGEGCKADHHLQTTDRAPRRSGVSPAFRRSTDSRNLLTRRSHFKLATSHSSPYAPPRPTRQRQPATVALRQ